MVFATLVRMSSRSEKIRTAKQSELKPGSL